MKSVLTLILIVIGFSPIFSQKKIITLKEKVNAAITAIEPQCIAWRRDFHEHAELSNREFRTSQIIADYLKKLGIETQTGIAKTGVVGILKGGKPGPCIALRADMDALPLLEKSNLAFASKEKSVYNGQEVSVMHACGHDGHMAILLSVAEVLSKFRNELNGTVKFIFQPAEEGAPDGEEGGAKLMVKEGVMENPKVDAVFGLHIESDIEVGTIEYKPGAFMASSETLQINIKGKGSHGSQPWKGIDPIMVATQIYQGLQNIVSRQSELTKAPVVITIGKIQGGLRSNIIPDDCIMVGTIRNLDEAMRKRVNEQINLTTVKIAEASGATAEVTITPKTLVTYNDPELVKKMVGSLESAAGPKNVKERGWITQAEDYSFYGTKAPSFFFFLGGMRKGMDPSTAPAHHTSEFYIDESGLITGVKAFSNIVIDYLNAQAEKNK